ncbi:MAG: hypothetical protein ACI93R_001664 [Flavobacteriales bacterium]|jgi:hypothetical protein
MLRLTMHLRFIRKVCAAFSLLFVLCAAAESTPVVKYANYTSYNSSYFSEIIGAAFEITRDTDGPYHLVPYEELLPSARVMLEVERGDIINVLWGPAVTQLSQSNVIPIHIPLMKGLSGYRLMFIKDENQDFFDGIHKKTQLNSFSVGQESGWMDVLIYLENNMKVIRAPDFHSIFSMLNAKRFEAFPVAITQITQILQDYNKEFPSLKVEEGIVIYYPLPFYFYVNSDQPEMAKRLKNGLERMIESGEFDRRFDKHFKHLEKEFNLKERRVFTLKNQFLMEDIPFDRNELWYYTLKNQN